MYTVHVDLILRYLPPMEDHAPGIRLNRTIELPFPPTGSISVYSYGWEGIDDPMGYSLKEITWDVDRDCFLADTEMSASGVPLAMIPYELRAFIDHGWRFGSYKDQYDKERQVGRRRKKLPPIPVSDWDYDEAETWETARGRARPKEFKTVLHAMVTTMAHLNNNCGVAYAMLKTSSYVDTDHHSTYANASPLKDRFEAAMREYRSMTFEQQCDWCVNVQKRYPRLIDVLEALE